MTQPLAYHVVVRALEAEAGWTPAARFACSVAHTLDGHLPYARYQAVGLARRREGSSEATVERMVHEWLATDVNPATQIIGHLPSAEAAVWALNAYTESARLGVRTRLALTLDEAAAAPRLAVRRERAAAGDDPELCRAGVLTLMEILIGQSAHTPAQPGAARGLSSIARLLGVEHSAAAHAVEVFEHEGHVAVARVAELLGCSQRTLERRLRQEGVTAEALRRATRVIRATGRLRSQESLTDIAADAGYADLAHMSREFRSSCGMSPSLLRRAWRGEAGGEQ